MVFGVNLYRLYFLYTNFVFNLGKRVVIGEKCELVFSKRTDWIWKNVQEACNSSGICAKVIFDRIFLPSS